MSQKWQNHLFVISTLKLGRVKVFFVCLFVCLFEYFKGFPGGTVVKNLPANAGDARYAGSIPRLGRSSGVGNGNPLQYSCLESSMDRGAWQANVRGVKKSWT